MVTLDMPHILGLIVLVSGILYVLSGNGIFRRPQPDNKASLILSAYGVNKGLMSVSKGTLSGLPYNMMMTGSSINGSLGGTGRMILMVQLPKPVSVHIAGFGLQDKSFAEALATTNVDETLESVKLEGDFPDYFHLYWDSLHQVVLRQVLAPDVMLFLVEDCKRLHWELVGSELYFSETDRVANALTDDSSMVEDVQTFLEEAYPTLQRLS